MQSYTKRTITLGCDKPVPQLRFVQLSDLHLSSDTDPQRVAQIVKECNAAKPEFILITGDLVDCDPSLLLPVLHRLGGLQSPVYYVSGNHDLFYGMRKLRRILNGFGFVCLDNRSVRLRYNEKEIILAGIADRFARFFAYPRRLPQITASKDTAVIFCAHQPKDYKIAQKAGASVFVCGHTHGGQIYPFHLLVRLVQPYLSGLHRFKGMWIYVNNGLGTWGIKHRYKAKAEIAQFVLKQGEIDEVAAGRR